MNSRTFQALESSAVLCSLDHLGLISLEGEDAQDFLQGQVTQDSKLVTEGCSQLAGYCTAKGRLLATLMLWKTSAGYCAELHGGIAAGVQKRLGMYVLRSKVKLADAAPNWSRFGLAGGGAEALLSRVFGTVPQQPLETLHAGGAMLIRLHGTVPRFEVATLRESAVAWQNQLQAETTAADTAFWEWLEIRAGVPQIRAETQEQFVPQMVNLDLLGGISLKKGCYTGQEIVARTHYLGKVKRRMHLAHVEGVEAAAGEAIFGVDSAEAVGMVVNASAAPQGGCDLLAEVRLESVEAGPLKLAGQDGPELKLLELPYGF